MKRLRELRNRINKTMTKVAGELSLSKQCYNQYELGKRQPDLQTLANIAKYYNVSTDYLPGLTDEPFIRKSELLEMEQELLLLWNNCEKQGQDAALILLKNYQKKL